jgi:hypothetical protein
MNEVNRLADVHHSSESNAAQIGKLTFKEADAALQFLRAEEGEVIEVDGKKLLRRIDVMVMPLMFGAYLSQYFDKSLLNYAAVMGTNTLSPIPPLNFTDILTTVF